MHSNVVYCLLASHKCQQNASLATNSVVYRGKVCLCVWILITCFAETNLEKKGQLTHSTRLIIRYRPPCLLTQTHDLGMMLTIIVLVTVACRYTMSCTIDRSEDMLWTMAQCITAKELLWLMCSKHMTLYNISLLSTLSTGGQINAVHGI